MKKNIQTPAYQNLIKDFESFIIVRGYKLGKSNMHKSAVIQFLSWMEQNGVTKIKEITSKEVVQYF
jgi:hypothetical protein